MKIDEYLKQPFGQIVFKLCSILFHKKQKITEHIRYTYLSSTIRPLSFQSLISLNTISLKIDAELNNYLYEKHLQHQFNTLGRTWTKNTYSFPIHSQGQWIEKIVAKKDVKQSKKQWGIIQKINPNYEAINWQKDTIGNFEFDAKKSYIKQRKLVNKKGIDIKQVWEIGRLQHLPQLALLAKNNGKIKEASNEFKCQVLDFMLANPIGMGAQWECAMEVGIRACNLLLAYDWFSQLNKKEFFDNEFQSLFLNYIYAHALFIENNFEYKPKLTANHYLGNILGLAFIGSYLQGTKKLNEWKALSIQAINQETQRQFFNDGGNFEGSTAYHRLSAEMLIYATAILAKTKCNAKDLRNIKINRKWFFPYLKKISIEKLNQNIVFPKIHFERLFNIAKFTKAYTKPNGTITQIGDNDSGRLFKLNPIGKFLNSQEYNTLYSHTQINQTEKIWDECDINHSALLAGINGFFKHNINFLPQKEQWVSYQVIHQLTKEKANVPLSQEKNNFLKEEIPTQQHKKEKTFHFSNENLLENICLEHFEDFGLIVFKSDTLFLTIYYGANEKAQSSWGHQHNDKLSFELAVNGKDIVSDPGSYCYTSNPKLRNQFRSTKVHSTICINNEEQNPFPKGIVGLFNYIKRTQTKLLYLSKEKIILSNHYAKHKHYRIFELQTNNIKITDYCNSPFTQNFESKWHSNGYGKMCKK